MSTVHVLIVMSFLLILAYFYGAEMRDLGLGHGLSHSDCLTREEMTKFIRRHHASDHLKTGGLQSLSARLGLVPPHLDLSVDWGAESGDEAVISP